MSDSTHDEPVANASINAWIPCGYAIALTAGGFGAVSMAFSISLALSMLAIAGVSFTLSLIATVAGMLTNEPLQTNPGLSTVPLTADAE